MEGDTGNQSKDRSRTRWTPSLDKIFADLVVQQIQLGNRPNNVFDKKTWNYIRDEFNKQTDLNFNNNQLRKHLDVLRTRFNNLKSASVQNDFALHDTCGIGFDLWEDIGAQPRSETIKVKDCPIYEQLCTIFTDTSADGKYAQSSHFEGLDKSFGNGATAGIPCLEGGTSQSENPSSSRLAKGNTIPSEKVGKNAVERKRKRPSETHPSSGQDTRDEELNEAMAEALLEMVAASRWREVGATKNEERFTITNCIRALDEIQNINQQLYFSALDLFEEPTLRETFLSLKGFNGGNTSSVAIFNHVASTTTNHIRVGVIHWSFHLSPESLPSSTLLKSSLLRLEAIEDITSFNHPIKVDAVRWKFHCLSSEQMANTSKPNGFVSPSALFVSSPAKLIDPL